MKNDNFLKLGDVIHVTKGHKVQTKVPKHFTGGTHKGDFSLVESVVTVDGDFEYLRGSYIVIEATMAGGAIGSTVDSSYPDGWRVTCESVKDRREISFYQSGCFNCVNEEINVIGKAERVWTIVPN